MSSLASFVSPVLCPSYVMSFQYVPCWILVVLPLFTVGLCPFVFPEFCSYLLFSLVYNKASVWKTSTFVIWISTIFVKLSYTWVQHITNPTVKLVLCRPIVKLIVGRGQLVGVTSSHSRDIPLGFLIIGVWFAVPVQPRRRSLWKPSTSSAFPFITFYTHILIMKIIVFTHLSLLVCSLDHGSF